MSLTTILTQFALTVGASLAERVASALSARIKQEPKPEANPVDIAIATKSAVSADREGKIASARGKCWHASTSHQAHGAVHYIQCNDCGMRGNGGSYAEAQRVLTLDRWNQAGVRRLGDYGPGGE